MNQYWLTNHNKRTTLMQDVNKLATSDGGEGENAVLLLIFL